MKPHPGGAAWEQLAERWLRAQGLRTVQRNFHCRYGEIDLVMHDGNQTVFVEVRYRADNRCGGGLASVTLNKQQRLARAAAFFLTRQPHLATRPCRFDVLALSPGEGEPEIDSVRFDSVRVDWVRNAFESPLT